MLAERTILDYAVRIYSVEEWEGDKKEIIEKVEIYTIDGIERYILENDKLIPDVELGETATYLNVTKGGLSEGRNWERVPLIPFRYNSREIPLIKSVKSLQDGINEILSDFRLVLTTFSSLKHTVAKHAKIIYLSKVEQDPEIK
ncbi:phage portal protein [Lysinibacillus xylanilyticus]|uniref:phage portal protein n=1 Tax=Lysinibacillus xylanilyticus TaxID=582475 RepID=UPI0038107DEC